MSGRWIPPLPRTVSRTASGDWTGLRPRQWKPVPNRSVRQIQSDEVGDWCHRLRETTLVCLEQTSPVREEVLAREGRSIEEVDDAVVGHQTIGSCLVGVRRKGSHARRHGHGPGQAGELSVRGSREMDSADRQTAKDDDHEAGNGEGPGRMRPRPVPLEGKIWGTDRGQHEARGFGEHSAPGWWQRRRSGCRRWRWCPAARCPPAPGEGCQVRG